MKMRRRIGRPDRRRRRGRMGGSIGCGGRGGETTTTAAGIWGRDDAELGLGFEREILPFTNQREMDIEREKFWREFGLWIRR